MVWRMGAAVYQLTAPSQPLSVWAGSCLPYPPRAGWTSRTSCTSRTPALILSTAPWTNQSVWSTVNTTRSFRRHCNLPIRELCEEHSSGRSCEPIEHSAASRHPCLRTYSESVGNPQIHYHLQIHSSTTIIQNRSIMLTTCNAM